MTGDVSQLLERLESKARGWLAESYAPGSSGPLRTAIKKFAQFARTCPTRALFKLPRMEGDLEADAHNEWTLILFACSRAEEVSARTKRPLKASSIEQSVSLVKGLLSHQYGFQLGGRNPRLKALLKRMRAKDPLMGIRRKRRGLRRKHLHTAYTQHACFRSASHVGRWGALATAWATLARGGEVAAMTRAAVSFHVQAATRSRPERRYAIVWLRPLKKKAGAAQPKVPQIVPERAAGDLAYTALRRAADAAGKAPRAPLFCDGKGRPMTTAALRTFSRRVAGKLGMPSRLFGAHSARVGGATDLAASGKASRLLLQAKGRWGSDIGAIYARMTRRSQIAAVDLMYDAKGRDLEELLPDFAQPA